MKVNLQYFGVITEIADTSCEAMEIDECTVQALKNHLKAKYEALALVQFKVAVNRKIVESGVLAEGDQVVIMPPFSGG